MTRRCHMKKFCYKSILSLGGVLVALTVASSVEAASHVVVEGDSMFSIAEQYGVDPYQLAEANTMDINGLILPGQTLEVPGIFQEMTSSTSQVSTSKFSEYVVQEGDSFYGIVDTFSLDLNEFLAQNQLSIGETIHPGQILTLRQTLWTQSADTSGSSYYLPGYEYEPGINYPVG